MRTFSSGIYLHTLDNKFGLYIFTHSKHVTWKIMRYRCCEAGELSIVVPLRIRMQDILNTEHLIFQANLKVFSCASGCMVQEASGKSLRKGHLHSAPKHALMKWLIQ